MFWVSLSGVASSFLASGESIVRTRPICSSLYDGHWKTICPAMNWLGWQPSGLGVARCPMEVWCCGGLVKACPWSWVSCGPFTHPTSLTCLCLQNKSHTQAWGLPSPCSNSSRKSFEPAVRAHPVPSLCALPCPTPLPPNLPKASPPGGQHRDSMDGDSGNSNTEHLPSPAWRYVGPINVKGGAYQCQRGGLSTSQRGGLTKPIQVRFMGKIKW